MLGVVDGCRGDGGTGNVQTRLDLDASVVDPSRIAEWQLHTDVDAIVRVVSTTQLRQRALLPTTGNAELTPNPKGASKLSDRGHVKWIGACAQRPPLPALAYRR